MNTEQAVEFSILSQKKKKKRCEKMLMKSFLTKNLRNPHKHFKTHLTLQERSNELETFPKYIFY